MENQVGRRGNVPTLLIIGYKSYIANRLSQHLKRAGINVDFLSQSGKMYSNNKVLTETSILKHRNSLKYSFIINCAGPDRNFCKQFPSDGIRRRKEIIYKICQLIDYGIAKNVLHLSTIHVFGGVSAKYVSPKPYACPNDPYGYSHVIAENTLIQQLNFLKHSKNFTILRLPNLFGHSNIMLDGTLGLFGNEIIQMACKGKVKIKAKTNNLINLFPLGLLCNFIINECIKEKYLGKTINLYPERPTKILEYVKQIRKHVRFSIETNISTDHPHYSKVISDIQFDNFFNYFDNEIYETFLYFKKNGNKFEKKRTNNTCN